MSGTPLINFSTNGVASQVIGARAVQARKRSMPASAWRSLRPLRASAAGAYQTLHAKRPLPSRQDVVAQMHEAAGPHFCAQQAHNTLPHRWREPSSIGRGR